MIGTMLEGRLAGDHEPVLIITFLNATPQPKAIFIRRDGRLGSAPIDQLAADWHYDPDDAEERWKSDFGAAE